MIDDVKIQTWENLWNLITNEHELCKDEENANQVAERSYQLFMKDLENKLSPMDSYNRYKYIIRAIFVDAGICREKLDTAMYAYWDLQTFDTFDVKNKDLYRRMGGNEHPRRRIFGEMSLMFDILAKGSSNDFLEQIAWICHNHQQEKKEIISAMAVNIRKYASPEEHYLSDWMALFMIDDNKEPICAMINLKKQLQNKQYTEFSKDLYQKSKEDIAITPLFKETTHLLLQMTVSEDQNNIIPLDVWLSIGKVLCKNPFSIFNAKESGKDAKLLLESAQEIGKNSFLLKESDIQQAAMKYQKTKGSAAKLVRKWLWHSRMENFLSIFILIPFLSSIMECLSNVKHKLS